MADHPCPVREPARAQGGEPIVVLGDLLVRERRKLEDRPPVVRRKLRIIAA